MQWTIAIIFLLLWALGLATSVTLGGFIHVALGVAIALIATQFIKARCATPSTERRVVEKSKAAS